jgi:predicted membrane GTPase involved in stress response
MKEIKQATETYATTVQSLRNVVESKDSELRALEQMLEDERKAISSKYEPLLSVAIDEAHTARLAVIASLEDSEALFAKPKTITIDGVTVGFQKTRDQIVFNISEDETITRIKATLPDQAQLLIKTKESIVKAAIVGLEDWQRKQICVEAVKGHDEAIVKLTDGEMQAFLTEVNR